LDNIIRKVIESEYKAQKIIEQVENERNLAISKMESQIQKMKDSILLSAREKAESIKIENMKQAETQAEGIITKARQKASLMQVELEENMDTWVECLVNKVLNGNS